MFAKSYKRVGGLEPPQREQSTSLILESGALDKGGGSQAPENGLGPGWGLATPRRRAGELELHKAPKRGFELLSLPGRLGNLSSRKTRDRRGSGSRQTLGVGQESLS